MTEPKIKMVPVPKHGRGHRGKKSKITIEREETTAEIMNLLRAGMSQQSVAQHLGLTKQAVNYHFQKGLALLRDSIVKDRLDRLMLETETLELLREAHMTAALGGDIGSAKIVINVHEKISSLWGLSDPAVIGQIPAEKEAAKREENIKQIIANTMDTRIIDTENEFIAEVSPAVLNYLEGRSIEEYVNYIVDISIKLLPDMVSSMRNAMPEVTGTGHFKGIFGQTGNGFEIVGQIDEYTSEEILDKIAEKLNKTKGE